LDQHPDWALRHHSRRYDYWRPISRLLFPKAADACRSPRTPCSGGNAGPSDLQNPLVLILASAQHSIDSFPSAVPAIHHIGATSDPVAVARFFHSRCKAVLDGLLGSNPNNFGIFGDVSNYFGVVESNGRGTAPACIDLDPRESWLYTST
jgi:hypothetical protein